jgi:hypothetical protein
MDRRGAGRAAKGAPSECFCVLSAPSTALLLIVAFALAFFEARHEKGVAILFVTALLLLMASLVQLARNVQIALRTMHLD